MAGSIKGRIHSVETFGAVDGPGIRFVVFFQGCPLRCLYCHNPDSWDISGGKEITAEDMAAQILRYKSFIKNGGVTISGGEPLLQSEFAQELLRLCKENGFHTAIDTSGIVPLNSCKGAVDTADLILLDIKAIDDILSKKLTGSSNQNTKKMLAYCEKNKKPVWIRHVILPGYTMDKKHARRLGEYLSNFNCIEKVELLPFHKIGEYKWKNLEYDYKLTEVQPPEPDKVEEIKEILMSYGLKI